MKVLVTLSNNLLVELDLNGKKKFIYLDEAGNYLPTEFEIRTGHPINEKEWNFLAPKVKKKQKREATETELVQAKKAVTKRKKLLRLTDLASRMQWASENGSMRKAA